MISACLSIVQDSYSKLFSAAVINFSRQIIACQSFLLDGKSLDPEDRYGDIWAFLASELSDPNTTQVIIAVPYVWHVVRVEGIPVLALEKSSIYLKILHYLSENRYCAFIQLRLIVSDVTEEIILLTPSGIKPKDFSVHIDSLLLERNDLKRQLDGTDSIVMEPLRVRFEKPPPYKLLILYPSVAKAYAQFLFEACPSLAWAAISAGLIAKNENIYYFFASFGAVQSSQDIVYFLRQEERGKGRPFPDEIRDYQYPGAETSVISANEAYTMKLGSFTLFDNIDKIPLKYAVAMKKYHELSENNAIKFALLEVSKIWGIRLYCHRFMFEYLFRNQDTRSRKRKLGEEYLIYDPQQTVASWILSSLQHLPPPTTTLP